MGAMFLISIRAERPAGSLAPPDPAGRAVVFSDWKATDAPLSAPLQPKTVSAMTMQQQSRKRAISNQRA